MWLDESGVEPIEESEWPRCRGAGGNCRLYRMADAIGPSSLEALIAFVASPEPGSRLTMEHKSGEFLLRVTGGVQRTAKGELDLAHLQALHRRLQRGGAQAPMAESGG